MTDVTAVAVDARGRVVGALPLAGYPGGEPPTIGEVESWCDWQLGHGLRVVMHPGLPALGVVVAEEVRL